MAAVLPRRASSERHDDYVIFSSFAWKSSGAVRTIAPWPSSQKGAVPHAPGMMHSNLIRAHVYPDLTSGLKASVNLAQGSSQSKDQIQETNDSGQVYTKGNRTGLCAPNYDVRHGEESLISISSSRNASTIAKAGTPLLRQTLVKQTSGHIPTQLEDQLATLCAQTCPELDAIDGSIVAKPNFAKTGPSGGKVSTPTMQFIPGVEDSGTEHVRLVSLGCACGPKQCFKFMNREAATLPFDWIRSRLSTVLRFMQTNFEGFLDGVSMESFFGSKPVFRSHGHTFIHDDPRDCRVRESYMRRFSRFNAIDAHKELVLFVRAVATTDELIEVPDLLRELLDRFGEKAHLLLILDFQDTTHGAAFIEGHCNLLVYCNFVKFAKCGCMVWPAYREAIIIGLKWASGQSVDGIHFDSIQKLLEVVDHTDWGLSHYINTDLKISAFLQHSSSD